MNIILTIGLPAGTLVGINLQTFSTPATTNFHGIRNVPAGLHFLYTGAHATAAARHGRWIATGPSSGSGWIRPGGPFGDARVLPLRWDVESEQLVQASEAEVRAGVAGGAGGALFAQTLADFGSIVTDPVSVPVPGGENGDRGDGGAGAVVVRWRDLVRNVPAVLDRVFGPGWEVTTGSAAVEDADEVFGTGVGAGAGAPPLGFSSIDLRVTWPAGAVGRARTEAAQDRGWALGQVVAAVGGTAGLLGEAEAAFVGVLALGNVSCLMHWRRVVEVVLTSRGNGGGEGGPALAAGLLALVRRQLAVSGLLDGGEGGGLFDLSEEGAPFLRRLLVRFREGMGERGGEKDKEQEREREKEERALAALEDYLAGAHGWEGLGPGARVRAGLVRLEDGDEVELEDTERDEFVDGGEYAPAVVELSAEQRRALFGEEEGGEVEKTLRQRLAEEEEEKGEELEADGEGRWR